MSMRRIAITGTGVITALGDSRRLLHDALCSGRRGLRRTVLFDHPILGQPLVGEISEFEPAVYLGKRNFRPLDRTSQLLVSAAKLALDDSGWSPEALQKESVGLVVGTTFCSLKTISGFDRRALQEGPSCASALDFANTVINAATGQAAIWHHLRGVNSTISTGITSALEAIAYAASLIREGAESAVLAGGVEELCIESLLAFNRAKLLFHADCDDSAFPNPFQTNQNGFSLAEGAALVMLEDWDAALERGAVILAEVRGAGSCFDCSPTADDTDLTVRRRSACVAHAISAALDDASLHSTRVEAISLSANGNYLTDRAEAFGLETVFNGGLSALPVTATKSMVGESMGASAGIQAIDAIETMSRGSLPGTQGHTSADSAIPLGAISTKCREIKLQNFLVSSVGLDGHCSAIALSAPTTLV
jgi:3-oxoacyl-[acyl-carrier-protein] synthase II